MSNYTQAQKDATIGSVQRANDNFWAHDSETEDDPMPEYVHEESEHKAAYAALNAAMHAHKTNPSAETEKNLGVAHTAYTAARHKLLYQKRGLA